MHGISQKFRGSKKKSDHGKTGQKKFETELIRDFSQDMSPPSSFL